MLAAFNSTPSLRKQLFLTLTTSFLLIWCFVTWVAYDKGFHEAEELMDGQLALSARLLDGQINHEESHHPDTWHDGENSKIDLVNPALIENFDPAGRLPYEQELAFQIWSQDGALKLRSTNADEMKPISEPGYHVQDFAGLEWRIFVKRTLNGHYLIQVAHPVSTREKIGVDIAERMILPFILTFPFLLVVVGWAIRRTLRPLNVLAENLSQRTVNNLDPLPDSNVPKEMLPIIRSFNILLNRVQLSVQNERRFTSNAAHELRTPIAGIKLYSQLAQTATQPEDRNIFFSKILNGVARTERLIDQMLKLARLDPENSVFEQEMELIDLRNFLLEIQDNEAINLRHKQQSIRLKIDPAMPVIRGHRDLLMMALSNLIGNASRYSPEGTEITLGSWDNSHSYGLYVEDQGPGIDEKELPIITQRFKRGKDVTGEGFGLGLAIVERIADIHHASLSISNVAPAGLHSEIVWKK